MNKVALCSPQPASQPASHACHCHVANTRLPCLPLPPPASPLPPCPAVHCWTWLPHCSLSLYRRAVPRGLGVGYGCAACASCHAAVPHQGQGRISVSLALSLSLSLECALHVTISHCTFEGTTQTEEFRKEEADKIAKDGQVLSEKVYYTKQTVGMLPPALPLPAQPCSNLSQAVLL